MHIHLSLDFIKGTNTTMSYYVSLGAPIVNQWTKMYRVFRYLSLPLFTAKLGIGTYENYIFPWLKYQFQITMHVFIIKAQLTYFRSHGQYAKAEHIFMNNFCLHLWGGFLKMIIPTVTERTGTSKYFTIPV